MNHYREFILDRLPSLLVSIKQFTSERDWYKFDHPRNLCLAMLGEVGELAEQLQFQPDNSSLSGLSSLKINKIAQEVADVSIYLIRFADLFQISFPTTLTLVAISSTTTI